MKAKTFFTLPLYRNSILTTFKRIIKDDDYFDIFDSYIEHIISILGNYFGNDHEQFLDLIFDLINAINSPHLEVDEEELKRKLEEHAARIHDLVAERNNAVLAEDSTEEARISAEIEKVEQSQQDLIDSQSALDSQVNIPPRMETDDKVFLRILHIFYGFFQAGKLKKDIDRLPTMINKLVCETALGKCSASIISYFSPPPFSDIAWTAVK